MEKMPKLKLMSNKFEKRLVSDYNSWLNDINALDEIRKTASDYMIAIRQEPRMCLRAVDAINEFYRIMRPLMHKTNAGYSKAYDRRFSELWEECSDFLSKYESTQRFGKKFNLPIELWDKINKLYNDLYLERQKYGFGIKAEWTQSEEEILKRGMRG